MQKILKTTLLSFILILSVVVATPVLAVANPIGPINPPSGSVPEVSNPNTFVSSFVRTLISAFLIVAFIIAVIWMILAGIQFITAGGDPKNISTAWSRIYWGIIGLVVVLGSFAIIKMVETFFNVKIISDGLTLPRI